MMKILLFASCAAFLSVSDAGASEFGPEETALVRAAEEISESVMDDDEKIARLTRIETRVREIRNLRTAEAASAKPRMPENPRPISAFVLKQTEETLSPAPGISADERGPTPLVRIGYWIMRFVGWALVVGISAAALLLVGIAVTAFFERLEAGRGTPPPKARGRTDFITRDGVVPERLR